MNFHSKLNVSIFLIFIVLILTNLTYAKTSDEWFNEGNLLYRQGNYSGAIEAYDKAIAMDQSNDAAWYNKGGIFLELGRYEEAIEAYNKTTSINPNDFSAWSNKGLAFSKLGRYEEAIEAYNKTIAIVQNDPYAWYNKGNALFNLGRYEEAIEAYNRAITIDKNYTYAYNNKGSALFNLGRYEEAIEAYDRAIAIDQNFTIAWNNKKNATSKLERHENAAEAYDKTISVNYPQLRGFVTDNANMIDPVYEEKIAQLAQKIERETTVEIAVVTIESLQGESKEMYAVNLFKQAGIGKKDKDNGLLILVAKKEREYRFEVGYGLESTITDSMKVNIGDRIIVPNFKNGEYGKGIYESMLIIEELVKGNEGVISKSLSDKS